MTTEEKIAQLVDALIENQPSKNSDRFVSGDTDSIATGSSLTVTWTLSEQWVTRLVKAYADDRTGCAYTWLIDGKTFSLNELEFYKGKPIKDITIKLTIANTSGTTQTIGYYIQGWGDYIG